MERNDYEMVAGECVVYSAILNRSFYGATLGQAQANRDAAERVYYRHHKYDLLPVED